MSLAAHIHRSTLVLLVLYSCMAPDNAWCRQELGVESLIYVGTRTGENSEAKGIYLFRMRTSDDPNIPEFVSVTPLGLVAETANPTFIEIDSKHGRLFCVNDVTNFDAAGSGAISAFSIDPASGKLTLLNQTSSMGAGPCHLVLDHTGNYLLAANTDSGNVVVFPLTQDGKLREATDVEQHNGSNNVGRQNTPHPRGITFSPDNRFAFVCDSGLDGITAYRFDAGAGELALHEPAFAPAKAGAGPRYLVFRRDGKFAYCVNERSSTVTTFAYETTTGALKERQSISTLPEYYDGPNTASWIGVHRNGESLLVSNCGHHSVVLFTIDADEGTLTYVEDQSTYGKMPRHFGMDALGKHFVVANQDSGNILILRAPENARVKPGGNVVNAPSPTCAKFLLR